ncbi:MAG: PEP-CTERM sorting domain-containing protein [Candidatus Nealsonbacteria bacterium]|nr:PEP-CTERM sorting domain-containing protein [Candidatus Nealsonbacteria bacterium]
MERSKSLTLAFLAAVCLAVQLPEADAAIVTTGDVSPDNGYNWHSDTRGYVGGSAVGELVVNHGSDLVSHSGRIGYGENATGLLTVDGVGSTWTAGSGIEVAFLGNGTLNITGGAAVSSLAGHLGARFGGTGKVTVDGAGSTWNSGGGIYVGHYGDGTLNITNGATVFGDWSNHIGTHSGSTGSVTIDGAGSMWSNGGVRVGTWSDGTLDVTNGGALVTDGYTAIGSGGNSTGHVTIDGVGSTWTHRERFHVGNSGNGTLSITAGATVVVDGGSNIGTQPSATGIVTIDGTGSRWTAGNYLYIGSFGRGTVNISGGSGVSATRVVINTKSLQGNTKSLLGIDIGNGSLLEIDGGSGTITNDGEIRILAGAGATAGNVYEPIAAGKFSGSGGYQPVGGTWHGPSHQFTASDVVSGAPGAMVTIDRSETQRVLIDDAHTGWSVGASFLAADVASEVHVTATAISDSTLAELASLLQADDLVRGAWMFEVTGAYNADDPAYLSFDVGPWFDPSEVTLWYHDGSQWAEYEAADLTCNGDYASFTVTGFSGYAVSAVPEPGSLGLLAAAALALAGLRRWRRV